MILTTVASKVSIGKLLPLLYVYFKMRSHWSTAVIYMDKSILKSADDN